MTEISARLTDALASRYTIEGELGAGGMANVYLAHDVRHDRKVAVKVLRPELANVLGADRFLNEIKVTAGLQHPHILPLHDSGDADSFLYYVMPYVEGESLRDKLRREGTLQVSEAVELLREVADGLAYAHGRGVVHRDIKPDNVLLSGKHALLADLGIARAVSETTDGERLTTIGIVLGTPEYMAPEQAAADPHIDFRADIYAFGIVAYEMLTGRTPFAGKNVQEVLTAHLIHPPTPIGDLRPELPDGLCRLVMKCLEKNAEDRWQSAETVVRELGLVARGESTARTEIVPTVSSKAVRRKRIASIGLAAALVMVAVWFLKITTSPAAAAPSRIVVLPFDNLSGADDEYLSEGVTRDINTRIAKIGDFAVIAHGSAQRAKATGQGYRDVADQLDAQYIVDGSVSRAGDRMLITAALVDPQTGDQIWTDDYPLEYTAENIFAVRGAVAQQVAIALDVTLSPALEAELTAQPTDNLEAYQEYLLGLFHWEKRTVEAFDTAIEHFERAIALDSSYALAYAGLADVYLVRPWFSAEHSNREGIVLADSFALMALELDPTLGQPHATLALAHEWQLEWEAAEREFVRSIELDPSYAAVHHWYGLLLARMGRHQEAQAESRISLQLDPLSPIINQDVGYVLNMGGEWDAAIRQYERTVELHPDFSTTMLVLAMAYLDDGRFDDADDMLLHWARVTGSDTSFARNVALLAAQHATTGESQSPTGYEFETLFPPFAVAPFHILIGEHDKAIDILEQGYADAAFGIVSMMLGPPSHRLEANPRFEALLERVRP